MILSVLYGVLGGKIYIATLANVTVFYTTFIALFAI